MESQSRDSLCAALEQEYVHDVYNKTAHHFVDAKYKAWPRVKQFLQDLEPGSIVADVGCGSGKYLNINETCLTIGCDRSSKLVQVAGQHGHNILVCDNLRLPFRDRCFDAVVSIGVIHHFTTPSRRSRAIQELARVLAPGGKLMIYVWAMEQKHRKFKSQDVLVPWHLKMKSSKPGKLKSSGSESKPNIGDRSSHVTGALQRNTNIYNSKLNNPLPANLDDDCVFDETTIAVSKRKTDPMLPSPTVGDDVKKHFMIGKKGIFPSLSSVTPKSIKIIPKFNLGPDSEIIHTEKCKHMTQELQAVEKSKSQKSIPKFLMTKFLNFLGSDSEDSDAGRELERKQLEKDLKYKKLLDDIVAQDTAMFQKPVGGESIPSVFAFEGFAVREFPGSSRNKDEDIKKEGNGFYMEVEKCNSALNYVSVLNDLASEHGKNNHSKTSMDDFRQKKCSDWLKHEAFSVQNQPIYLNDSSEKDFIKPISGPAHGGMDLSNTREQEAANCNLNIDNSEWSEITAKAIKTMESKMETTTESLTRNKNLSKTTSNNGQKLQNPALDSPCKCKQNGTKQNGSNKANGLTSEEMTKLENTKFSRRTRSESSVSSFSSLSDSDSDISDEVEDMSMCTACCRGDSIDESSQKDQSNETSKCYTPSFTKPKSSLDNIPDCQPNKSDSLVKGGATDNAQAYVKLKSFNSSHDSGYSESLITQDKNIKLDERSHLSKSISNKTTEEHQHAKVGDDSHKRFYHVFKENELLNLVRERIPSLHVLESFYDHANWCVIAEKVDVWMI